MNSKKKRKQCYVRGKAELDLIKEKRNRKRVDKKIKDHVKNMSGQMKRGKFAYCGY